ncbi:hypothetical protein C8Q78DRAFT_1114225 [Trametes maxima]|nr:hypothetical protein C8Q78DRAFT_1114225 [Trametes maxima]
MADPLFPLTIDDTSPVVLYAPFADTFGAPALAAGWNPYFTISGFSETPSGQGADVRSAVGNGTSMHLTAHDGAALQINWNGESSLLTRAVRLAPSGWKEGERAPVKRRAPLANNYVSLSGTDITIYGTLVQPLANDVLDVTYSVVLDGTATTNYFSDISSGAAVRDAESDVLASFKGLQEGPHSIQVTLHNPDGSGAAGNTTNGAILAFDRAVMQEGSGKQSGTPTSSPTATSTARTAPVSDDEIAYRGQWNFTPGLLPGSTTTFHTSNNVGDRATLLFNGSAVGLTGLTTPASGAYNVSLDDEEPVTLSARASFTASAPTLLYFRTGLDPSIMHHIEVVNAGPSDAGDDAGSLLVFAAVNVTTVENPGATPIGAAATSSGLSKGAIAALAIGLTLAVAAAAVAAVFFVRRRRKIARRKREMLVNPRINRAGRLSFLFPHKRHSHADEGVAQAKESRPGGEGVLHISSPNPDTHEKDESDDDEDEGEGGAQRFSAAEKGKARAMRRSNASKNSDGSYSIDLPDLTIAQVPRGYLPTSMVPSTPSPPRTLAVSLPSPTSPRSARPRGPREMQGRDSTRGILLTNLDVSPTGADEDGFLPATPSYLPDAHISPLRVEFATELPERPERRTERHISTGTSVSLPQSLKQALSQHRSAQTPDVPSPTRPDAVFSFLDFNNSSTSTSLSRSQRQSSSNSTGKSGSSSQSKRNTGSDLSTQSQSVNWASLPPDRRISLGLSMTVSGGPNSSRPSLSPSVLLQPVPLPPPVPVLPTINTDQETMSSSGSAEPEGPDQPFPYDAGGGQLPSPTDSIPFTVSDIHFRHSTQSSISGAPESRRASAQRLSGSHRLPHPPLPGVSPGPSSPTRGMHRRQASASGSQSVPPFIVQRILGRTTSPVPGTPFGSPTAPQFASMTGTLGRSSSATATVVPSSPPPASPPVVATSSSGSGSGRGSSSAHAQTPGSGSTTTVFGFQLGRHR